MLREGHVMLEGEAGVVQPVPRNIYEAIRSWGTGRVQASEGVWPACVLSLGFW